MDLALAPSNLYILFKNLFTVVSHSLSNYTPLLANCFDWQLPHSCNSKHTVAASEFLIVNPCLFFHIKILIALLPNQKYFHKPFSFSLNFYVVPRVKVKNKVAIGLRPGFYFSLVSNQADALWKWFLQGKPELVAIILCTVKMQGKLPLDYLLTAMILHYFQLHMG